ncbi:hypothetical protein QQZ08_007280 [Neonectria magnoliae]|uniref:Mitochondrial inner membrane protein 1 n=1 Tax=Neonectria magnoliae TaxID=2732573 RepID=A0ABR1HYA8_9HYPO
MLRTSQSLLRLTSRVSSAAPARGASIRFSANLPRYRAALYSSKPTNPPPPKQPIDREHEKKLAQETLKSDPAAVSTQSSVRHVVEESQSPVEKEHDMGAELKQDIETVTDTFSFKSVPRESRILGLAGTLPYLGTSLSTVFLSWDLNKDFPTGNGIFDAIFIDHETARYLLSILEPVQLGYGAVIISFLGAIHWGLEYAEKHPSRERTRFRYGTGLAASLVAWPTLFMPVEYALTSQFMAFVALYAADSRAVTRGWAPHWYNTYRFLLTAMVGLAIFISLVGRSKIGQHQALSKQVLQDRIATPGLADTETDWAKLEAEEKKRIKKEKAEAAKKAEKEEQERKQKGMKADKGHKEPEDVKDDDAKESKDAEESEDGDEAKDSENSKDQESATQSKDEDKEEDKEEGKEEDKEESRDSKNQNAGDEKGRDDKEPASKDKSKESDGDEKNAKKKKKN